MKKDLINYKPLSVFDIAPTYLDKLKVLREFYLNNEDVIINHYSDRKRSCMDAYIIDWNKIFTPIEKKAWNAIRTTGEIILYPQYPALQYFIDFANPKLRIGLELDGENFHSKEKDMRRDKDLKNVGWKIYRITGKEMTRTNYKDFYTCGDELITGDRFWGHMAYWILETGEGVIEAIKALYFSDYLQKAISFRESEDFEQCDTDDDFINDPHKFKILCELSLDTHRLA